MDSLRFVFSRILLPAAVLLAASLGPHAVAAGGDDGWSKADEILTHIHDPRFPDRAFPITDFGAAPGADATTALRRAIAACHAAGGGRVVVPAGVFLTGAIRLLSNVDLDLAAGATLRFSTDPAAYLPAVFTRWEGIECMNYAPLISAFDQENIAVTGRGTLDGSASNENWWKWTIAPAGGAAPFAADVLALNDLNDRGVPPEQRIFGAGHYLRPNFFQPYRCRNVLIEGVTIIRSPMWELHPVLCTNFTARNVTISSLGPNNDGCDPESCRYVLLDHCNFTTGDDCIAIKSGRNRDGRRIGVASEDFVIRDCAMKDGHAGVAIGSEVSGDIRNIFVEDCTMDSPNLERVLRLKSNARRGGVIEGVHLRRIEVGHVSEALLTVDFLYEDGPHGPFPPVVRNIFFDHVTVRSSPRLFFITGFAGATIDGIHVSHSTISGLTDPEVVEQAGRIELDEVELVPTGQPRSLHTRVMP
jgi:polygalacturonase